MPFTAGDYARSDMCHAEPTVISQSVYTASDCTGEPLETQSLTSGECASSEQDGSSVYTCI